MSDVGSSEIIVLGPGEGRSYSMPTMTAVFKADETETGEAFAVSEWTIRPNSDGPGAHSHEANIELFYVVEGTASILVGSEWRELGKGSFVQIPAGLVHDFANRSEAPVTLLNIFIPGGFERMMPQIQRWFADNNP